MDKNRQQSSDFYRLITETVKIYLGKSMHEFQTYLRLEEMSEILARKSKVVFLVILARDN